jgi:hypothetical protein
MRTIGNKSPVLNKQYGFRNVRVSDTTPRSDSTETNGPSCYELQSQKQISRAKHVNIRINLPTFCSHQHAITPRRFRSFDGLFLCYRAESGRRCFEVRNFVQEAHRGLGEPHKARRLYGVAVANRLWIETSRKRFGGDTACSE